MSSFLIWFTSYNRSNMQFSNAEIRAILKYLFMQGKTAAASNRQINGTIGDGTVSIQTAERWFRRFRAGINDTTDPKPTGRPSTTNDAEIIEIIGEDRHMTAENIANRLKIDKSTVLRHLHATGYTKKLGTWLPQKLSVKNKMDRILFCDSLMKRNTTDPFLKRLVIGDEKWITYDNVKRKRSWSQADETAKALVKPGLATGKGLLCVWWDWKGIIYYELVPADHSFKSDLYCQQLTRLKQAIDQKRPELSNGKGLLFHYENARPYATKATDQKLREIGWEVIIHPAYSPDIAPSDYHLFRSMQNALVNNKLVSRETCENWLEEFFSNRDAGFYERGIMVLPSKWQQIIDQNGEYLT